MRRWNGWGDRQVDYAVPAAAADFLEARLGQGQRPQDAELAEVAATVPPSRLPPHPLVSDDTLERVFHARGQSFPDWVALRSGRIGAFPDGVALPRNAVDLRQLLSFAADVGAHVIPYGGGTSVVGHINPTGGAAPVLTVSMRQMNSLLQFDHVSRLATFGSGASGPEIEAALRQRGFTLGHFPQSFELSTLGGWIATRSSGQQSLRYGRIEDLFVGGRLVAPTGELVLPPFPASAAGPDLRQLVLGSEGRFGIISEATVRVTALPERDDFHAVFFPDFARGQAAVREMAQARLPLSMLRLSTAVETETTLALAGHERLLGLVERYLAWRGSGEEKCMLMIGITGDKKPVQISRDEALSIAGKYDGIHLGQQFGKQWKKSRFRTPYLRNTLWERGYAVDTLETATRWDNVGVMLTAIETALYEAVGENGERVHVFSHLSHMYPQGASIYTTYLFRLADDPEQTLARWARMKEAASRAIVDHGGTISHQHGVGLDHRDYLEAEKGSLGLAVLHDVSRRFDPRGLMNPGKLLA